MLVRMTIADAHPDSGQPCGLFRWREAVALAESHGGDGYDAAAEEVYSWFCQHLTAPSDVPTRATFWFRSEAGEMTRQAWALATFIRLSGQPVLLHRVPRLDRVVYEDEHQVAGYISARKRCVLRTKLLAPLRPLS
jgi:hypothetical protein